MGDLDDTAASALRCAAASPHRALTLADTVLSTFRADKAWAAASVALRARGVALLQLRDLEASTVALRSASAAARTARSPELAAEAAMSLSATLCVRGRLGPAVKAIERALSGLDGVAAARGRTQRAGILLHLGRFDDAIIDVRQALPILRAAGDAQWQVQALSNRSLAFIAKRMFPAAQDDLMAARKICRAADLELHSAYVEHNLGWLHSSRGEVVDALEHFDLAEAAFAGLGLAVGSLFADRGELLLSVRLLAEARVAAETAVTIHRAQRRQAQVPEAQLLLSTVALVQGHLAVAAEAADSALRGYRRIGRRDGMALARFARLQARSAIDPKSVVPAHARRSAAELTETGWVVPALEATVLAGVLALGRGRRAEAREDLRKAGRARRSGPADARVRAWLAEALLRQADGNRRGARSAISAGLRVVENFSATVGATELRAHVSTHRGALAALGLRMAIEDGHAGNVLSFVERGRASALAPRAARLPDDPDLSRLLADLRSTALEIAERRSSGRSISELSARQLRLEHHIAEHARRVPAIGATRVDGALVPRLAAALGDEALVEYIELDGGVFAVTVVAGQSRLHPLGSAQPLRKWLPHLSFALRRLADPRSTDSGRLAARSLVISIRASLDALLIRPLARELGGRALVIVPAAGLQAIPWSMLPSCEGRPVTVNPSASLWLHAATTPSPSSGGRVVAVAGPHLINADQEVATVASLYREPVTLRGAEATVATVSAAMEGAALVHIAAHGRLRSDNPLFSSLLLADGPLTVHDLERLPRVPAHVVLAACEAAVPHVLAADEVLGMAAVLLARGTTSLIAPVISVDDAETVTVMQRYHHELSSGAAPSTALAAAQEGAGRSGSAAWAVAVGFVCVGAGSIAVSPGHRTGDSGGGSHIGRPRTEFAVSAMAGTSLSR